MADPVVSWLRDRPDVTVARAFAGAELVGVCPRAMVIAGSLTEWRDGYLGSRTRAARAAGPAPH